LTIASIINTAEQFQIWESRNEKTAPLSKNARRKRARYLSSIDKKYYSIVNRVQSTVNKFSWREFNTESPEADKWTHLQMLLEEFIPYSVAH
jgi:hypothetical protein